MFHTNNLFTDSKKWTLRISIPVFISQRFSTFAFCNYSFKRTAMLLVSNGRKKILKLCFLWNVCFCLCFLYFWFRYCWSFFIIRFFSNPPREIIFTKPQQFVALIRIKGKLLFPKISFSFASICSCSTLVFDKDGFVFK